MIEEQELNNVRCKRERERESVLKFSFAACVTPQSTAGSDNVETIVDAGELFPPCAVAADLDAGKQHLAPAADAAAEPHPCTPVPAPATAFDMSRLAHCVWQ